MSAAKTETVETKMNHPKPTTQQPQLEPDTVYRAEDDFYQGMMLLVEALDAMLSEDASFPTTIVRRGRAYALDGIKVRHDRIMEDLVYIQAYVRQCSKSIDWPAGRRLS